MKFSKLMLSQQLTAQLYWLTITIPFGPSIPSVLLSSKHTSSTVCLGLSSAKSFYELHPNLHQSLAKLKTKNCSRRNPTTADRLGFY